MQDCAVHCCPVQDCAVQCTQRLRFQFNAGANRWRRSLCSATKRERLCLRSFVCGWVGSLRTRLCKRAGQFVTGMPFHLSHYALIAVDLRWRAGTQRERRRAGTERERSRGAGRVSVAQKGLVIIRSCVAGCRPEVSNSGPLAFFFPFLGIPILSAQCPN